MHWWYRISPTGAEREYKTESGWTELSAGQNFTQDDVEINRLWYKHTATSSTSANTTGFKGHDSFRFTLSNLDNESLPQSFFISVHTVQKGQRLSQW
ncbi:FRAS1-related extracellular matrix protein 1b [Lates japonicus]|uniref:FRAS1-related extracellular matrix protein 1b n=1 Tax=Lates japonicus TaxID=270547 RepID=A0AAD3MW48_LATJO|nr:FRAS1-related extracellular matrix protein 1b [Lates japonicus]